MDRITVESIARFKSARSAEPAPRSKTGRVSAATINKHFRHLKAALGVAKDWGYIAALPKIAMLREMERVETYVPQEHFAAV